MQLETQCIFFCYSQFYSNSFDWTTKAECKLFRYVQRALDLVHENHFTAAINVMVRIGKCVIKCKEIVSP